MEIREVHEGMIGAVKNFLADREGFRDANGWDGLFNYSWKLPAYPYGYVITEGEEILAFVGTIFSERVIDGRSQICCNMNTWYVVEEQRQRMLALTILKPMLKMNDILFTALSPGDLTVTVLERLGFQLLDEEQISVPITPQILPLPRMSRETLVLFDKRRIAGCLDEQDRRIHRDHVTLDCEHLLIKEQDSGRYCYVIATTSPLRKVPLIAGKWLNLCYVSNPDVFVRNFRFLRNNLLRRRFFALRYDARLLPNQVSKIFVRAKRKRQYKWKEAALGRVDNLYSEIVTFNKY